MKKKLLWLFGLLFMPVVVFATADEISKIVAVIFCEAFLTIHWCVFVFVPLSRMFTWATTKKMLIARVLVLLVLDIFLGFSTASLDLIVLFVLAFFTAVLRGRRGNIVTASTAELNKTVVNEPLKCPKCGAELKADYKFCISCGTEVSNVVANTTVSVPLKPENFDSVYSLPDDKMLDEFIKKEMMECNVDKSLLPSGLRKIRSVLHIIFAILIFVYITMIFFHFPILTYVIGFAILVIYLIIMSKYSLIKYLKRQIKSRPQEKIKNIVMSVKNTSVKNNYIGFIALLLCAIIIPIFIFKDPIILYEKMDNGYGVRFYLYGWSNFKSATIPEEYKGEKVVSLRGNTFSNMFFLESVSLPDTITEIRGQAFKNDYSLVSVNLPSNLEYLGGGAFYNCRSLKSIEIPDSVTYMGGEIFYGASSLESVKLSENITEIRGDSFEYCTSLKEITIPDKVQRIGGHAFYGDASLATVNISENSELNEIGSSAFRDCSSLESIVIPDDTTVNSKAFKNSPTDVLTFSEYALSNKYEYHTVLYLKLNTENEINSYQKKAKLQGAYLELISIERTNGDTNFKIKYTDETTSSTFVLSSDKMSVSINDNLYVEADDDIYFESSYYEAIGLDVYYN